MSKVSLKGGGQTRPTFVYPNQSPLDFETARLQMLESIRNCMEQQTGIIARNSTELVGLLADIKNEARRTRIAIERCERRYLKERREAKG